MHVSVMTTVTSHRTHLDTIMIIRCQGFVAFQPMEIFRFRRKEQFTFFQRCLQPLYFSWSKPPTQRSLPFCTYVQFSHDSICTFNDQILKKYEKIEGCEQSTVPMGARVARNFHSSKYIVLQHSTFSCIYN